MSRTLRIVLDFALGSVTKVRPVISQAWGSTKVYVEKTRAKPLVCNSIVYKLEEKANELTDFMIMKMTILRNNQLPKEAEYLQKKLDCVKEQMEKAALNNQSSKEHLSKKGSSTSKNLKKVGSISWRYLKVEAVPPLTIGFFNGPFGNKLETAATKIVDRVINTIEDQIKTMDEEVVQKKQEEEAAIKAQIDKQYAEEKKKADEKKAEKAAMERKATEASKQAADTKAAEKASKRKETEKKVANNSKVQQTKRVQKSDPKKKPRL